MTKPRLYLAASILMIASAARAQGPQDTSPEYQEAKQRLQEGKALYGQHDLEGARLKFEQACAVLKTPACLRALGLSQYYTGRYIEALQNLQKSLDDKELDTESRKQVTDLVQQAFDKTAHIEIRAPGGGRIRIDDTLDAGNAPLASPIHVTVGSHAITVTVGEKTERMTVECPAGKVAQADFQSRFPNEGGGPETPGGETHRSTAGYVVPSVLGVAGLTGIALGIGFAMDSQNNYNAAVSQQNACAAPNSSACATVRSLHDSQTTSASISVASYIGGGVLAAAGVLSFFLWPRATSVRISPSAGPQGGGVLLQGSF